MAEPSLGEGIGLQQGANRDDFWAKQVYARGVERKREREKADEDLIKMTDLKKDYSKALPYYANKMAAIQYRLFNDIAVLRQNNKNTARSLAAEKIYKAQVEMGKLEGDNARAMGAIADPNTTIPPEYLKLMTSPNTTDEEWASMHDGEFFMTDATGTFASRPYKEPDLDSLVKYEGKYPFANYPTGKYEIRGNQRYQEEKDYYDKTSVDAEALQVAKDPQLRLKARWDTKGWKPEPNETREAFTQRKIDYANKIAYETAERNKPRDVYQMRPSKIDQPREQSEASKKVKPSIVPFDQTKFNESVGTKTVKNEKTGKDEEVPTTIITQGASYDEMANVKPAKNVTIPVTDELIAINPELKNVDAISVTVNNLVRGYSPKGKKAWYGIGIQSDYVAPEEGSMAAIEADVDGNPIAPKKRSSYNPKIPLEMIRQALELAGNDLTEFGAQQAETKSTGASKNNTVGKKPEL